MHGFPAPRNLSLHLPDLRRIEINPSSGEVSVSFSKYATGTAHIINAVLYHNAGVSELRNSDSIMALFFIYDASVNFRF